MPRISINEIDNTLYSASNTQDNIVFVPGIATTGPYDRPILITNIRDFIDTFGSEAPKTDSTTNGSSVMNSWEYAYNLINAGLPVLFRRVVCKVTDKGKDQIEVDYTDSAQKFSSMTAKASIYSKYNNGVKDTNASEIGTITAKYPGTYGNNLCYTIDNKSFKVYLNTKSSVSLLESYEFNTDLDNLEDKTKLKNILTSINNHVFNNVYVSINKEKLDGISDFECPKTKDSNNAYVYQPLANGLDNEYNDIKAALENGYVYKDIVDKYIYDVKFITSGGITCSNITSDSGVAKVSENSIYQNMLDLAYARQDCLALFDIPYGQSESHKDKLNGVFKELSNNTALSYAAAYAPWCYTLLPSSKAYKWTPPSYIFLSTLANSISNGSFSWQVPAGVNRGLVSNISDIEYPIGEVLLNSWQNTNGTSINPIMNLRNYGYTIYGQRTLYNLGNNNKSSALREVGVRLVTIDIKKKIFEIAMGLTFEANTIHTWSEFIGQLDPYLSNIKSNGGLTSYEILIDSNTTTIDDINNNTVVGIVRISPTRAAENFDIDFEINQDTVSVSDSSDSFDVVISE